MTPERKFFNETMMPDFGSRVSVGSLVYDIGKEIDYGYDRCFTGCHYNTIDINPDRNPDIVADVTSERDVMKLRQADAVICMGMFEQVDNPFKMVNCVYDMVKKGGLVLFGIMSLGFPIVEIDYQRFTPAGAKRLLEQSFRILDFKAFSRGGDVPSYIYAVCEAI